MIKALKFIKLISFILTIVLFSTIASALSSDWIFNDKSKVRLISSKTSSDNTDEIVLGLEYQLDPGWKTYWKSPGGGGFPQKILWNNSSNIENLKIYWPTPTEFEILGLKSLGYEEKVIFPLIFKIKNKNHTTNINLNINYLVCKDICIRGNADLYLTIPAGEGQYTEFTHVIEKKISSLPNDKIKLSSIYNLNTQVLKSSDNIEINVTADSNKNFINTDIFIHTPFGLPIVDSKNTLSFNLKKINSKFYFNSSQFSENSFPIEILINDKNHNFSYLTNVSIKEKKFGINNSLYYVFLVSLIGGFILNLMPCVFPVLSIKLLSVLNNKLENVRFSFLYTAIGIISSFLLLAIFFFILKHIGISIAWGMQFQEPYFLMFILIILTLFCFNTLGVFEIQLPSYFQNNKFLNLGNNLFSKNFFNGFFATLLATPCTAPFVGTAITIAFTQTPIYLFIIFTLMGFGMSFPYLIVSIFPGSILFLPKSGKWITYTKYFLSILLIATIIWVLNILNNFYNELFILIFLLLVLLLFLTFKFNFQKLLIRICSVIIFFSIPNFKIFEQDNVLYFNENWINFKEIDIYNTYNSNIVFLDITAEWCATCQFNKLNVLDKKNIIKLFEDNNIKLVRADWTKPDKQIDSFLKSFNKFGIPFNAFFSPKYPDGLVMSELLTEKEIKQSIEMLK